ncbi:hypothetical protein V6N12_022874 [Hibiscus sabdariffa]|uniref:Protein kinase domain-containing protein n=1 Tax=Hibiscus sabdariffa TaxID=183260 RepID=A0ABR2FWD0_9ROSI
MGCFSCFTSSEKKAAKRQNNSARNDQTCDNISSPPQQHPPGKVTFFESKTSSEPAKTSAGGNIAAETFTFRQLATATRNFRKECLIGEGGFGRVYRGKLDKTGQYTSFLSSFPLIYVELYELLNELLFPTSDVRPGQKPLDWYARMKIAVDAAKGLEYLHDKANPPVIYRDLKSSNILLDKELNAKLSDFGLAKLGPMGDNTHVSSRVMGTYGYCAPEYQRTGHLTVKSDLYSFGVVLLELITGRRVIDTTRPNKEQNLVTWAQPMFKEPSRFPDLIDPLLGGNFPVKGLQQAVAVAAMCLQEEAEVRPLIRDVVSVLSCLANDPDADANTKSNAAASGLAPKESGGESYDDEER